MNTYLNIDAIQDGSVLESKLSPDVQEKLNAETLTAEDVQAMIAEAITTTLNTEV